MDVLQRSNVVFTGQGQRPLVFAHGFGCDQNMWRFVAPAFEPTHRVVLFDHIGCGRSDLRGFDDRRHARIEGWAEDVVDILEAADLRDAVFVGHSVSGTIGALAANAAPGRIGQVVMLCPSPRYLNDPPDYLGGFERSDIDALLDMIESNMLGWANYLAPIAMGAGSPVELVDELRASFCAIDPYITRRFATATFLGDNRLDLQRLAVDTLVVEMTHDAIAPESVGRWLRANLPAGRFATVQGNGHCPHMTHPAETIDLLRRFIAPTT